MDGIEEKRVKVEGRKRKENKMIAAKIDDDGAESK